MAINLQKGQSISLTREAPGLKRIICGLGWDVSEQSEQAGRGFFAALRAAFRNYDLDSSVICLDGNGKVRNDADVIYFRNLKHRSGAITHLGDNLTGAGEGEDEQIIVDLSLMPSHIVKLIFTVNIFECKARKQDFGQVKNAFVRLVNMADNQELVRYNFSGIEYEGMTGLIIAELCKHDQEWKFVAIGDGVNVDGLDEILLSYR